MAWLYLPVSVVSNWASDLRSAPNVTALSVSLSGKVTPRPLSWRGWRRRTWTTLLSGTTLKRSTANRGAALWISSLRATRVSRSPLPESAEAPTIPATSFPISQGSSKKPSRATVTLKTWETILGLDSEKSSPIWKVYITALQQDSLRRSKWARRINASGSLFWRSPMAHEPQISPEQLDGVPGHRMFNKDTGRLAQVGLNQQTALWATPNAAMTVGETNPNLEYRGKKIYNAETGRMTQTALSTQARHWKTPQGTDGEGGVMERREGANGHHKLRDHAANWRTPTAQDSTKWNYRSEENNPNGKQITLSGMMLKWATPRVADSTGSQYQRDNGEKGKERPTLAGLAKNWNLPRASDSKEASRAEIAEGNPPQRLRTRSLIFQSSPQDPATLTDGETSLLTILSSLPPSQKRMNPMFCEWLMGLPLGWTHQDTKINLPLWEMAFCQLLRQWLSAYWQSGRA